jgi:predicted MFS family arabinose efflux permease
MLSEYDKLHRIIPALAISAIGALFYNILPLYVGAAQDSLNLSNSEVGLLPAAFFAGYNLVTVSAFFWIRRWNWRKATLLLLPIAILSLILSVVVESWAALLLYTAVSGGGFAAVYGIGTTILADTSNPARWYGLKIAIEAVPGAALLFILPSTLVADYGFAGVVYALVGTSLLLTLFLPGLPSSSEIGDSSPTEVSTASAAQTPLNSKSIWLALLGTLLFFSAASGLWAFIERMGAVLNFNPSDIGLLLSLTLVFATLGSLITAWLGKRLGNVRPFAASGLLMIVATALLYGTPSFPLYAIGAALLTFGIGMGLPFAVAEVADLDVDGRYIILSVPAIGSGAMIGPAATGYLTDGGSFDLALIVGAAIVLVSILSVFFGRRQLASEATEALC